jgi:hypothetical protein
MVARQFIAWNLSARDPSRRDGMIRVHGLFTNRSKHAVNPIIPSLRDGTPTLPIPGSELPGYDHSVPSGRDLR